MKILVIASEASPFLRTSTVADIVSSLCLQLRLRGHDVRLALPRYRSIQLGEEQAARIAGIEVPLGAYTRDAEILRLDAVFESAALPVYLVENDFYFDRDKAYGYLDDYERFIFFTRSVLEFILDQSTGESSWVPDLIHGHDWIAGLVPSWLRSPLAQGSLLESIAFVYTIHNAGFQGEVSSRAIRLAELENYGIYQSVGESTGTVNLMARGILAADAVNTVSVRHACEVEKGEYAEALRQALILSQNQLIGILNGFDYDRYDPAFDDEIVKFNSDRLSRRAENKKALQCMCQFETGPAVPLLGFAGRLITEKGLSLLEGALEQLLREEQVQVVIAGPVGDYRYRESFTQLQAQFPRQFAVFFGTDDLRSRRICAGADIVLIPSLYEPCGVHQMLAMRYGAIPVVHATGGLIDTVAPLSSDPIRDSGKGRGFLFDQPTSASLLAAVQSALDVYRNDTFLWHDLQQHNMGIRFSWQKAVREYEQLYKDALSASKSRPALEIGEAEQPDCHDLLVHAILEVEELSMATSRHTYLKAVARSVRELLESQAVLIWIEDENVPQRWRIGAHSFARGNGPSQPAFDPETLYQYAEEDSRSWRYVYQLDSGARQTQSQLGYLGSEVAQMEGWSVQLTAPMTTHGTVLGRIDVFDQRPDRRFTAWEMNALGALASALAANLDKSRRTAQREELLAADRAMAHAQTFEEIVQILLRCGKNLTHADTARLHLTDGNLHELDDGEGPTVQVEKTDSISAELKLSDGRILGQVAVLKALPGSFTAEDQMALTTLARQAANTIQAAHAREQRDRNRVQLLSRLSGALAGGQDLQTLMNNIVQTIAALLEAQAASLYLVDEHTNCLVIRAAFGKHAPLLKVMATYDIGEGVTGYIAEQGEILLASSIEELQAKVPAYKAKYVDVVGCMPNAFLGIPLIVHPGTSANRVVGVLKLEDRPPSPGRRSNLFSEDDVRSAEMVAQVIATVVYNAQVSDAQIRNISSNIGALSSALGGGKEMKVLLNDVVETIAQVLHADASSLYLINETTGKLVIQAAFGYQKVLVEKEATYEVGEGITGTLAKTGVPIRANTLEELQNSPGWAGKQNLLQMREPNSFLGLPLKVVDRFTGTEKIIGVLKVEDIHASKDHPEERFTDQDVLLVQMMANVIATVVYNTQVGDAQIRNISSNIGALSSALGGGKEMKVLLNDVVETIAQVLHADASSLYLINETTGKLVIQAAFGYQKVLVEKEATYEVGEGITGTLAKTGVPIRANTLEELQNSPGWAGKQNLLQMREPNSFLGLPLKVVDRFTGTEKIIGVLKVEDIHASKDHPEERFTDQDVLLVQMMANVIATVVYNTQVGDTRLKSLSGSLAELSNALARGHEMKALLNDVVETMARVLHAEASSLYLIDEATGRLVIQAAFGYQKVLVEKEATYEVGEGITGTLAKTGVPIRANNLEELQNSPGWAGKQNLLQMREPNSFLGLPLKVVDRFTGKEKIIGVLKVEDIRHSEDHPENWFTDQDVLLVTMMANVIATVIQNTRQGEARIGATLERMGILSAPIDAAPALLHEAAHSSDSGLLDQLAVSIARTLDSSPELITAEAQALVRARADAAIYSRIASWAKTEVVRWEFSLLNSILSASAAPTDWHQVEQKAAAWQALYHSCERPDEFSTAAEALAARLALAIRGEVKETKQDASDVWYGSVLDVQYTFGERGPLQSIPVLFQRQGTLDEVNIDRMVNFVHRGFKAQYNVAVLVLWAYNVTPNQIAYMKERARSHAVDVVVARPEQVLGILGSLAAPEEFRSLVLQATYIPPFVTVGAVPDALFFGRDRELRDIIGYVGAGRSCAVIGGRRIGKTSILQRLHRVRLPESGFRTIFLDCSPIQTSEQFLTAPLTSWRPDTPPAVLDTFGALLAAPPTDKPLVLLLDEADKLVAPDREANWRLFNLFRSLSNSGGAQIVLSGERVLSEALRDPSSPLFNFANELLLGPLTLSDVQSLITTPLRQLEIELADEKVAVRQIYDFTSGHPNVVQRLCARLVRLVKDAEKHVISLSDIQTVVEDPRFLDEDFLSTYWDAATPLEKIISLLMAKDAEIHTQRSVRRALQTRCDLYPSAGDVKNTLQRLVDLRSILKHTRLGYTFAVKAFPKVVASMMTLDDTLDILSEEHRKDQP